MKNSIILVLSLLFLTQIVSGQGRGRVNFVLNPPLLVSELLIDGKPYEGDEFKMKKIKTGTYSIKYTSDFYIPLDTVMVVKAGKKLDFKIQLTPDPNYVSYREQSRQYERKKITNFYVPVTFTAGLAVLTASYVANTKSFDVQANEIENAYNKAGPFEWEVELYKTQMDKLIESTKVRRRTITGLSIATGVSVVVTAVLVKRFRKNNTKPTFIDLYGFSLEPHSDSNNSGLSLKYTF